jgi:hypothetical protein
MRWLRFNDEKVQLAAVGKERDDLRNINAQLHAQLVGVGKERDDLRNINAQLHAQLVAVGKERDINAQLHLRNINAQLHAQFVPVGKERDDLRHLGHRAGVAEIRARGWHYTVRRLTWREQSLCRELWGEPTPCPSPPKEIPAELVERFTMDGNVTLVHSWGDCSYPANYPLIYGDDEIDAYIAEIARTLGLPAEQRDWTIYGKPDRWICEAIAKYPIVGKRVLNMGSLSPWYEAMFIHFGARPVTMDYIPILVDTERMEFMNIVEWEEKRERFEIGFSISSVQHDGLGMYGDPIDPDGDLKAMRKMKERITPGGLLFLAVPSGRDQIRFNECRIYGRLRLPLLMQGWEWIDSFGYGPETLDGNGDAQPLYVLRNPCGAPAVNEPSPTGTP